MADVTIERPEQTIASSSTSSERASTQRSMTADNGQSTKDWDVHMELALLKTVARCKPVGMHKHFRLISIQRQFNAMSPTPLSLKEIRERLNEYYGLDALEELEEEESEEEEEEQNRAKKHEFCLPLDEYDQLMSEHRRDEISSPSPQPSSSKKARTVKREASPSSSGTPTSEPDEGKGARRSSRSTTTRRTTTTSRKAASSKGRRRKK